MIIVDPPEGWKYGFPKRYDPVPGQSYENWLEQNGYPNHLIYLAVEWSRWWEEHEKE